MKASISWLKELTCGLALNPDELAEKLTSAGLEVDGMTTFGAGSEHCIVARVVAVEPHPKRSGLRLVDIEWGSGKEKVVCGAPNVPAPGGCVVFAPLGTELPAVGITIAPRPIGGIESRGMLCSEAELGLSDESNGIIVLSTDAPVGTRFSEAYPGSHDTIIELSLTPNRPDALGHIGLAREICALYGKPWRLPAIKALDIAHERDERLDFDIVIEDSERCAHYVGLALEGVRIAKSPDAIRWRLGSLGVRPISNVVDITNLAMLETGHPMHAFDRDRLKGDRIVVRRAKAGEVLETLDDERRTLDGDDLVIADASGPTALAGVMGGKSSEIGDSTTRVLFECATFDARGVRRAARRHAMHTESSHRFERGVDWNDAGFVVARALELAERFAGAKAKGPALRREARQCAHGVTSMRLDRYKALMGAEVTQAEAKDSLTRLGFEVDAPLEGVLSVRVPSHRPDVSREVDLIEEVARLKGLDAVPTLLAPIRPRRSLGTREERARRVRAAAVELGLSEAMTISFLPAEKLALVGAPPPAVELQNPLGSDARAMRTSLLPALLDAVARAARHGERDASLFEVARVFLPGDGSEDPRLASERLMFAAVLAGERVERLGPPRPIDVWDAKGVALGMLDRLRRVGAELLALDADESAAWMHPRGAARIQLGSRCVGSLGLVHPAVRAAFELDADAVVIELDVDAIESVPEAPRNYAAIPRFPAITRDLAVVVPETVRAGDIERSARKIAAELSEGVRVFDRYAGGNLPAGHVSLALRIVYRATDRTLTDAEVDARHKAVTDGVTREFGATLRA